MGGTSDSQKIRRAVAANGAEVTAQRAADEAEHGLAQLIGEATALHMAQLLQQAVPQLIPRMQPGCVLCVADAKRAEGAWLAACQEAANAAATEMPQRPAPNIQPSITLMPLGAEGHQTALPVCYQHFSLGPDVRAVGLVDAGGNAIMARGGA